MMVDSVSLIVVAVILYAIYYNAEALFSLSVLRARHLFRLGDEENRGTPVIVRMSRVVENRWARYPYRLSLKCHVELHVGVHKYELQKDERHQPIYAHSDCPALFPSDFKVKIEEGKEIETRIIGWTHKRHEEIHAVCQDVIKLCQHYRPDDTGCFVGDTRNRIVDMRSADYESFPGGEIWKGKRTWGDVFIAGYVGSVSYPPKA